MKITQTNTELIAYQGGVSKLIAAIAMIIGGAIGSVLLPNMTSDSGQKLSIWGVLIGVVFIVSGIAIAIFASKRTITMQKGGSITILEKRIIGGKNKITSIPVANIVAVRLSTYIDNTTTSDNINDNNKRRSTLALLLNNNDLLVLDDHTSNGTNFVINNIPMGGGLVKAPLSDEADRIANFLGVPLQADDASSFQGALNKVKDMIQGNPDPQGTVSVTNPSHQQNISQEPILTQSTSTKTPLQPIGSENQYPQLTSEGNNPSSATLPVKDSIGGQEGGNVTAPVTSPPPDAPTSNMPSQDQNTPTA